METERKITAANIDLKNAMQQEIQEAMNSFFERLTKMNTTVQNQSSTTIQRPATQSSKPVQESKPAPQQRISLNSTQPKKELTNEQKKDNETDEDRLARKQAMTLKTSGKIPRWDTTEDLRKFLKHTIRTFAEDCGQKPKYLATWIHICLDKDKNLHPFLLKDWAQSIVDDKPDISIPAFLKKFSAKVVPEKTTTFNFARKDKETLTNAVWRTLDETDSDDAVTPSGIMKALWVNEKDPWVMRAIKENFKWDDDITEEDLKKNAEKVDASCDYDFYKKSNEEKDDTIIKIDAFQQPNQRLNQPYRPINRPSTPINRFNSNLKFKYCEQCKNRFYPMNRNHAFCSPCFYGNINNRPVINRAPQNPNYAPRSMNRFNNQQNYNSNFNRNFNTGPSRTRFNNNFQNNRPVTNNPETMIKIGRCTGCPRMFDRT